MKFRVLVYFLGLLDLLYSLNVTGQKTNQEYQIASYYGSRDKGIASLPRIFLPRIDSQRQHDCGSLE